MRRTRQGSRHGSGDGNACGRKQRSQPLQPPRFARGHENVARRNPLGKHSFDPRGHGPTFSRRPGHGINRHPCCGIGNANRPRVFEQLLGDVSQRCVLVWRCQRLDGDRSDVDGT